ncbi:MAG: arginine--tRNA ligase, partial [Thermodesulfobacteriota bacterium]
RSTGSINTGETPGIIVERSKREEFGDFATNVAMLLAPLEKKAPRDIAEVLAGFIGKASGVAKCEVAGPGFINIFLEKSYWIELLKGVLDKGADYGKSSAGAGKRVQVEFVSANPTGPMHIGHGRGAAYGSALCNILPAAGYEVSKEFYINDLGKQVHNLGESIRLRFLEIKGEETTFGEDHYRGDYIKDIARDYITKFGDKDAGVDSFREFGVAAMLEWIKKDLIDFGVTFDNWFSESSLETKIDATITELKEKGHVKEADGATWLKTEELGDDKDRVLVKADGERTYFASDVAYHRDKFERGFDRVINIWGADHHGYEARVRAALKALGYDDLRLTIIFIQMVALLREGEPVQMGKRSGEFIALRDVMDEVGTDACRFFFLMRKGDAHLDFDIELAKKEAPENPVFYVQYCHARIASIIEHGKAEGAIVPESYDTELLTRLGEKEELDLIKHLAAFEEVVAKSADAMEPHKITFYLQDLAGLFHPYYNSCRVVTDDSELTKARLLLCVAIKTVIGSGLKLLGVSAPEKM